MSYSRKAEFDLAHTFLGTPITQPLLDRSSIFSHITDYALTYGDAPFVTTVTSDNHFETLSYRELDIFSRQSAAKLQREVEVYPSDVLAFLPANDIVSVVTIFGLLRSGYSLLLLNPTHPVERLRQQIDAIQARAVLRVPSVSADVLPDAIAVPAMQELHGETLTNSNFPIASGADALFFGTSGSTATSKLVVQSHYNAAVNADAVRRHHGIKQGDRILGCLPIYHVNGLHFTIFATFVAGAHVMLLPAFDPFSYSRFMEQFRPRIASVVPSILEALLGIWRQPQLPGEFNYFVSAAAPLTARTARAVAQKMDARVVQGYGLTETTNFSTTIPADLSSEAYQRLMLDAEIPSIGTAVPGNEVTVITTKGTRAAPGEVGEICMRGHNVMTGYFGNEEQTAEAFQNGWFHSQDSGFEIEEPDSGRSFFVITGRMKNIAKVRGETVSLDEMDRFLCALPSVQDAACVAIPHRLLGDEIIAAVVFVENAQVDLRTQLLTVFSPATLPSQIVRLETLPRTPTGKILRGELAQQLIAIREKSKND